MNAIKVSIDLLGTLSTLDKQSPIMHQLDIFTSLELHQELLGYGVGIFWATANELVVVVWGSLWSRSRRAFHSSWVRDIRYGQFEYLNKKKMQRK